MLVIGLGFLVYFVCGYFLFKFYLNGSARHYHVIGVLLAFSIGCSILLEVWKDAGFKDEAYRENIDVPIVLWWNSKIGYKHEIRKCYNKRCLFSHKRNLIQSNIPKIVAFYGTDVNVTDLPLPRKDIPWALLHEESPKNNPIFFSEDFLKLFNLTSTFSRQSHFPLNALYLDSLHSIKGMEYYIPLETKNKFLNSLAPVLYIQSDCDTLIDRDSYISKLGKYIKIDSYGDCLNNAELPKHLKNATKFNSVDFLKFVSQYKFSIAVENAICNDYITEKLWRPIVVGSVPIYFGSPSIRDWIPNYDSVILITDFNGPEELARYLNNLNEDDKRYENFLMHKIKGKINNDNLKKILKSRRWNGFVDSNEYENFVNNFECQLCLYLHDNEETKKVDKSHYDCMNPISMLTGRKNLSNHWNDIIHYGYCEGKVVSQFIISNISFNAESVEKGVIRLLEKSEC